uniref:uncharacterized protein LOC122601226 n=1 Tax=Erigeron canadensis TaxID=72917 RepID=UPI001CB95727|nr:uncharacterized protein LOC122601226 [Erigeron canadensis]
MLKILGVSKFVSFAYIWTQPAWNNEKEVGSLEMILIDEQGKKIHATIKKAIPKFKNMLQEFQYYLITNFNVGDATSKFMMVDNESNINFYRNTSIRSCTNPVDYGNGLTFTPFSDIANFKVVTKFPIDIIAEIAARGKIDNYTKDNKETVRLQLHLTDLDGILLNCTLWGDFATQVDNFLSDPKTVGRVVIIIQLAKLRIWNAEPQLGYCLYGTRILLNSAETEDFKNRLIAKDGVRPCDVTYKVPFILQEEAVSAPADWTKHMDRTDINELQDIKNDTVCLVYATIRALQSEHNWYYLAHRKCNRIAQTVEEVDLTNVDYFNTENHPYHCENCKEFVSDVLARYYLIIHVI